MSRHLSQYEASDFEATQRGPRIVIVGFGNPLRSDDGIGWRVAGEFQSRMNTSRIEAIACRQLMPEMAEKIRDAALVIFVDASVDGSPGESRHHRLRAKVSSDVLSHGPTFSHGPTPAAFLALAADLYNAAPQAHLFTVCGKCFGYGEGFSPEVARALPSVVAEIEDLVKATESVLLRTDHS